MSKLADELKEVLGRPEGQSLSTLDLMSLPSSVRRVVNLMLRRVKATYEDLCQAVAELPEEKRLSPDELREILDALCQVGWLAKAQGGDTTTYRVNLSPKPGTVSEDSPLEILEKEDIPAVQIPDIKARDAGEKPSAPSSRFLNWLKGIFGG